MAAGPMKQSRFAFLANALLPGNWGPLARWAGIASFALAFAALAGCTARYFHAAGAPPPAPRYGLEQWPYSEYWTGFVFNGQKIGFTHTRVDPAPQSRFYEVRSEAAAVLHFLGLEKKINLKSYDVVKADLSLERFAYDYDMDGNRMKITGHVADGKLFTTVVTAGKPSEQTFPLQGRIYPTSAIVLYPVLHGLEIGRSYVYTVYDGETQQIARVAQRVEAYEGSDLFPGAAYRIATELHGLKTVTWIDARGRPVFELAMNGVLISALEDEAAAKRYLAEAALNKQDALLDFSIVRVNPPLAQPRALAYLKVRLQGFGSAGALPSGAYQRCRAEGKDVLCEVHRARPEAAETRYTWLPHGRPQYLDSTVTVQARNPLIRKTAGEIAGNGSPLERINRLVAWMQNHIEKQPVDVFSALDVLETRKAECQGHAYLYAAFARALGIATRVVNGLVYSEEYGGFLYHSWDESWVEGRWLPVDPTFGQVGADATHIKLLEGERTADLLPLINWVGKIRIEVIQAR